MPNFDGGHYFLTALIPIKTEPMEGDPGVFTSPVHALRKLLARLPANPTLRFPTPDSPFSRVRGLHFIRLVIVDDVAYNGRVGEDAIFGRLKSIFNSAGANPVIAQIQDHLPRPYLMLAMDFDASNGRDVTRDDFLKAMWDVLSQEIADVLDYAVGFDKVRPDGNGFASYVAACQVETTMSFNDYYIDPPQLEDWTSMPAGKSAKIAGLVGILSLAICLFNLGFGLFWHRLLPYGLVFLFLGLLILAATATLIVVTITRQGNAAFPTDARTSLPNILKALYLQRAFTAFAVANQANATRDTNEAMLHAAFGVFLETHKPAILAGPTQKAGALGI